MFYVIVVLILTIVGLNFYLEAQLPAKRGNEKDSVESGDKAKRVAYPTETLQGDDLASARDFVEQLKRQRAEEQGALLSQSNRENSSSGERLKREKPANYSPTSVRKGVGKNYVDNSLVRKNIAKIERAHEEHQKRVQQIQAQAEQIRSAEFSLESKYQSCENATETDSSSLFPKDRASLRRAFIASEILSKPISLRK